MVLYLGPLEHAETYAWWISAAPTWRPGCCGAFPRLPGWYIEGISRWIYAAAQIRDMTKHRDHRRGHAG